VLESRPILRYPEGLENARREQVWWAMAHALRPGAGAVVATGSAAWQEELLEDLVSNMKVIADAMDLFIRGERFLSVREMEGQKGQKGTRWW